MVLMKTYGYMLKLMRTTLSEAQPSPPPPGRSLRGATSPEYDLIRIRIKTRKNVGFLFQILLLHLNESYTTIMLSNKNKNAPAPQKM